jgi:hypothetical protein
MLRIAKILLVSTLVLVGAFWGLALLLLPGVIRDQATHFGDQIGYKIEIGDVDLSPLLLRVRVNDIRLASQSGDALFALNQLEADVRFLPLLVGRLSFERIALDQPEVLVARTSGKSAAWNWQILIDRINKLGDIEPAKDSKSTSTPKISIDAFTINSGRVSVQDAQTDTAYNLGPLNIHLSDLSNQDDAGHVGGSSLSSKYTINLGSVKIPLPKEVDVPDRQLSFGNVTATGQWVENSESLLRAALDLRVDEGEIKSIWTMAANGSLTGKITIDRLSVKPWLSLAPSYQPLDSPSGTIRGDFDLKQDVDALTVDGDVQIDQLDIRVSGAKDPLLVWNTTALNRLHLVLPRSENKPGSLTINDVLVDNPKIRFIIDAQHQSNFRSLFSKPEPITLASGESTSKPVSVINTDGAVAKPITVKLAQPTFRYDIRSVRLKNGTMFFSDESIKPVFKVDVSDLNGSVQGISNEPGRYATLILNGRAAKTGSLRARGQLVFADPRLNNDVSLVFRNIPLNATNPYTMTFAGYAIDDGRIDVDLRYVTKAGQLVGKNRFVIKKIKLGQEVPDYQGTRLPLGLAIALLEDSDGMIDVNIPVKGNVNEPEFSVGHLVWQAVKTVLANVVTAPFRVLGAMLGIENVDAMAFVPGESALPPDGDEQLSKIAELLAKRPKSKLVIHGTYDPSVDAPEMARAMADQAILESSGIKVTTGEPLPVPNLTDPKVKAGLKSAYGAQVGRIKLGQRLLSLPDDADRDAQLRQELIQSYKVDDNQLKLLATQRANAVKEKLLSVDANLADRISIGDPESVTADVAGVPIKVDLEIGT